VPPPVDAIADKLRDSVPLEKTELHSATGSAPTVVGQR
jgi:hypothetical protein